MILEDVEGVYILALNEDLNREVQKRLMELGAEWHNTAKGTFKNTDKKAIGVRFWDKRIMFGDASGRYAPDNWLRITFADLFNKQLEEHMKYI